MLPAYEEKLNLGSEKVLFQFRLQTPYAKLFLHIIGTF